jgi:hypothetical protein
LLNDEGKFQYLIEFVVRNGQVFPLWTQGSRSNWQYKQLINFQWKDTCGTRGKFETTQVFKLFSGEPKIRGYFHNPNESTGIVMDNPSTGDIKTVGDGSYGRSISLPGQVIDEISPVTSGWPILGGKPISRITVRLVLAWDCDCNATQRRFDFTDDMPPSTSPRSIPGGPDR